MLITYHWSFSLFIGLSLVICFVWFIFYRQHKDLLISLTRYQHVDAVVSLLLVFPARARGFGSVIRCSFFCLNVWTLWLIFYLCLCKMKYSRLLFFFLQTFVVENKLLNSPALSFIFRSAATLVFSFKLTFYISKYNELKKRSNEL